MKQISIFGDRNDIYIRNEYVVTTTYDTNSPVGEGTKPLGIHVGAKIGLA